MAIFAGDAASAASAPTASVSQRSCVAGCSVAVTCALAQPPTGDADAAGLKILKVTTARLFAIADESELVPVNASDLSGARLPVGGWKLPLRQPWSSWPLRYSIKERLQAVPLVLRIANATTEDSGYYGCSFKDEVSYFVPLLVYDSEPEVTANVVLGSSKLRPGSDGELTATYKSLRSAELQLAVQANASYANLPLSAALLAGSANVTQYRLPAPGQAAGCDRPAPGLCRYSARFIAHLRLPASSGLNQNVLRLRLLHPGTGRSLWLRDVRLLDADTGPAVVRQSQLRCTPLRTTGLHGSRLLIGCWLPRLWLRLSGFSAAWSVRSPAQFPDDGVDCAYPPDLLTSSSSSSSSSTSRVVADAVMTDAGNGTCRTRVFPALDFSFVAEANATWAAFLLSIPRLEFVHAGRTMRLVVDAAPRFLLSASPAAQFSVTVLPVEPRGAGSLQASNLLLLLLPPLSLLLQLRPVAPRRC